MTTPAPPLRSPSSGSVSPGARNRLIALLIVVILVVLAVRACAGHENTYEHVTRQLNVAIQKNDLDGVKKLEDTAIADTMSRARLGAATDALQPLGKLHSVKEVPGASDIGKRRLHQFDVTFDKGTVREQITFNSKNEVVTFHYDKPVAK